MVMSIFRRVFLVVLVALMAVSLSGCFLVASPPWRNFEDHQGPSTTIWWRNHGYPCEPPLFIVDQADRDWTTDIPAHGCVFEYTFAYKYLGWCYDRSLALYGTAHTGRGNCEGMPDSAVFRWNLDQVMNGVFLQWCMNHGNSCLAPDDPRRSSIGSREVMTSEAEILAADFALGEADHPGVVQATGPDSSDLNNLYWGAGGAEVMTADAERLYGTLTAEESADMIAWREEHRPYVAAVPVLDKDNYSIRYNRNGEWKSDTCEAPWNLPRIFNQGGRKPVCWQFSWQWNAGFCGPQGEPFYPQNPAGHDPNHFCPNGNWPLNSTQSAPLMQWDATRSMWTMTNLGRDYMNALFDSGWVPNDPS